MFGRYKSKESQERALSKLKLGNKAYSDKVSKKKIKYYESPNLCRFCKKELSYENKELKFCSHSCSASFNNLNRDEKFFPCSYCGKSTNKNGRIQKYCDKFCASKDKKNKNNERRKKEFESGLMSDINARKYYRDFYKKVCSICELTEWNGNPIPLEVDHVDGNSENNFPSNLRFVCCNCAALLPTYKGGNKGNGRKYRQK